MRRGSPQGEVINSFTVTYYISDCMRSAGVLRDSERRCLYVCRLACMANKRRVWLRRRR